MGAVKLLRGAGVAFCLASGLLQGAATGANAAVLPAGTVTLFSLPKEPEGAPHFGTSHITAGPDGNLWFTENLLFPPNIFSELARITPQGNFTGVLTGVFGSFDLPGMAAGPDGNLWLTEHQACGLDRVSPGGTFTRFTPGPTGCPWGIAPGPDGNVWYTGWTDVIGRVTPAGTVTEFSSGITRGSQPLQIAAGPDGNLWFTEFAGNRIGRITPAGTVTEFSSGITAASEPDEITAGPDGNVWFTEDRYNRIGRITPTGTVTEFSIGAPGVGVTAGPDGNVWFAELERHEIGRITPAGTVTEFPIPVAATGITAGPDDNLWFTATEQIGRISAGVCDRAHGRDHEQCHGREQRPGMAP